MRRAAPQQLMLRPGQKVLETSISNSVAARNSSDEIGLRESAGIGVTAGSDVFFFFFIPHFGVAEQAPEQRLLVRVVRTSREAAR